MTRKEALARARNLFAGNGIPDASLEAEVLLRHVLSISRAELYTEPESLLSCDEEESYDRLIERRIRGEPAAYLTGHREFYGLDFLVNPGVLIPRPETELLVDGTIGIARETNASTIADIGTGCGAITVSVAKGLPGIKVYATDISPDALGVARANCARHNVSDRVIFLQGDLLEPLPGPVDIIMANLPYVAERELLSSPALRFEPGLALNGGPQGRDLLDKLCRQIRGRLNAGGSALLEVGEGQAEGLAGFLGELYPSASLDVLADLAGIPRVIVVRFDACRVWC